MKGSTFLSVGLVVLAVFAAAVWWFQTRAFYDEFSSDSISVGGAEIAVTSFQGIDATSSPIKLRACMQIDPAGLAQAPVAPRAVPLVAPRWFDCFDAKTLSRALDAGEAKAYLAAFEEFDGTERIVATYPDGRAYMWRQLTEEFSK